MDWIINPIAIIIYVGILALSIYGIINAVEGKQTKLPIVKNYVNKIKF